MPTLRWMGMALLLSACQGGSTTSSKADPAPTSDGDEALRLLARANTFASTPGKDALEEVDWPSVVLATGLSRAQSVSAMSEAQLEMLGGVESATKEISKTLAGADYDAQGKLEAEAYAKAWAGAEGCTSTPNKGPYLDMVPPAVVKALSPELAKRLEAIRAGTAFDVTCEGATGMLVLSEAGMVIAMEPLGPAGDDLELPDAAENRYVGYMNVPDE